MCFFPSLFLPKPKILVLCTHHYSATTSTRFTTPRVVLQISGDEDDRSIFLGLKFSIPGFFVVGKFVKYFFVWLDLSRGLGGIQNNLTIRGSVRESTTKLVLLLF